MSTSPVDLNATLPPVAGPAASTSTASSGSDASSTELTNQTVFLQLLIAQLKNQDPENPASGTEFVTQLAQFTSLEQETQSRSDLDGILKILAAPPAASGTSPAVSAAGSVNPGAAAANSGSSANGATQP